MTNRLIDATSPYLRQHAHNPVDWYPWGDEAFERARTEGKPVFLSIGYATCHWCHVMAHESFEDVEIARVLNERYVSIKVDREERPDVDAVYMTAVQALTGQGGWPMSVWLDADRQPFFAGTYFPARDGDRGAQNGFLTILRTLDDLYRSDPQRVASAAQSIVRVIGASLGATSGGEQVLPLRTIEEAVRSYLGMYDRENGGIRGAPKFPSSLPVRLLLREYRRSGDPQLRAMAEHTLAMMAAGGLHDQLTGGFHRYSTDAHWGVPHFEKMLYDNALLALAYAEAWQLTGRQDFKRVLRTTLDYLLRDMRSEGGAFFSATDADSEGVEGAFFVWHLGEIEQALGARAERFARFYGVTAHGNFEGQSVLYVPQPDEAEWEALAEDRERLAQLRELREHPICDDKILAAWNGLAISALSFGGFVLDEPRYVEGAAQAADFVLQRMRIGGRLQRSWRDGKTSGTGFLEDYAFVVAGLLDLYEATFDAKRLDQALELTDEMEEAFSDTERGGWFRSASDGEQLIAREKPNHDGAEPSGASVALRNVLRLQAMTGDDRWRLIAERALHAFSPILTERPTALAEMLIALEWLVREPNEVVLVWPQDMVRPEHLLEPLRTHFLPNRVLLGAAEGAEIDALAQLAPIVTGKTAIEGRPAAYVCRRGVCALPTTDPATMLAQLNETTNLSS